MRPSLPQINKFPLWIRSWNIRGYRSTLKIRLLRRNIELEKLGVIFLQETKCSKIELKSIGGKVWKGCEAIAVDANKVVGGIGILWNPKEVSLFNFSATQHFLCAAFHILGTCIWGFMTNVYGLPRAEQKIQFLDSLRMINGMPKGKPWIIGGDFNLIRRKERWDKTAKPHKLFF